MITAIYSHPDGPLIEFDSTLGELVARDDDGFAVIPIGPLGLIALGRKLIELGDAVMLGGAK